VGNTQPRALPLPGIVGLLMGITVGAILYYTGKQVRGVISNQVEQHHHDYHNGSIVALQTSEAASQ
jgi:hypothetical protein